MTNVLVLGDATALKAAIKKYGAECVWWHAGFERRREAVSLGLAADHIISIHLASVAQAKKAMDFDEVLGGKGEAKAVSNAKAKGEKTDGAKKSNK
tara:strand:+ start:5981 stop:6268 length:288 start_codon:yes stop_codon:yes gene_type:complete